MRGGDAGELQVQRRHPHVCILLVLPSLFFLFLIMMIFSCGVSGGSGPVAGESRFVFFVFLCTFLSYPLPLYPPPPFARQPLPALGQYLITSCH